MSILHKFMNGIKFVCHDFIISAAKQNKIFRKLARNIRLQLNKKKYKKLYNRYKVNKKMVIFEAYIGRSYACSPKAIYEAMLQDEYFDDYVFIWAFKKDKINEKRKIANLSSAIIVEYGTIEYYQCYAQAKYWITNSRLPEHIIPKPDQIFFQCWHGTPLKRLGYDLLESSNAMNSIQEIRKKYDLDSKRYSYMLSPSKFASEKFRTAFNFANHHPSDIILEVGYPRNDALFHYTEEDIMEIKKKIGINSNKKVILYAPTWRDNQHKASLGYTYELHVDFDYLKEKLFEEYVIIFRAHYLVANTFEFDKYEGFIYNVSEIDDINECYIVSDILITDYSSVFFDYANLKRPIIFYMYDLEEYQDEIRGFYIDLDMLPGSIVKTEQELIHAIYNISEDGSYYNNQYIAFNNTFNYLDNGQVSSKVLQCIFKGNL